MNNSKFPGGCTALMSTFFLSNSRLLKNAIDSIYANSVIPDQVLIVCDGPLSPDSISVLRGYELSNTNFKCLWLPKNVGLAKALNYGLENIKTTWVARCDDDDFNCPDRFNKQLNYLLENSQVKILGSNISEVNIAGQIISQRKVPGKNNEIRKVLPFRNPFNHMTVIFDRELAIKLGGYPIMAYQDYGLWIKMLGTGCIAANLQDTLVHATTGNGMYRRRGGFQIAKDEFKLARLMREYKFKSYLSSLSWAAIRAAASLAPARAKHLLYKNLLRK